MSKSNDFENDLLLLLFNNTAIANIGDAAGLQPSAVAGSLYVAFHTADPGEAGSAQTTSEVAYTGYAREAVARASGSGGWTVTGNSVSPTDNVTFGQRTNSGAAVTATYWSAGTSATGAGLILYRGLITTPAAGIVINELTTPQLTTASAITED